MIRVQYFARYREVLGLEREELPATFVSMSEVRQHLLNRGGSWSVLAESGLMCARNEELCSLSEPVQAGDEIAFFPPVTGG